MEVQLYRAEKVTTSKRRQFQVPLNRARQMATIWSDADRPRAIAWLKFKIHQVTPAKRKLFDKLYQHHEQQLLQEVGTKAIGPRSIFAKKTCSNEDCWGKRGLWAVNMTADMCVQFQVCLSDVEIEDTPWSIADTNCIVNQLEREICDITSKDQMRFTKEFSIRLVEFEAWWQAIRLQELGKTTEQHVIHFGCPKLHFMSHMLDSIQRIGSGDNFTTDISERLHIGNVKEAYRCTNKVNYIQQMVKHNDQYTGLYYTAETLSYHALQGWYDIHSAKVFNLLLGADTWWNTRRAHLLCLHHCQKEPSFRPVSQQVHHMRETHIHRSIKLTSLRDASVGFGITNFGQLFCTQIEDDWRHEVAGLVLGYDQNVLIDSIFIKLQNGLLYYCQPFHCPTSVERLGLDCKVK